jgi:ElaB/YqjD/DUF883 family membrane-anchored ribosome-binding protein
MNVHADQRTGYSTDNKMGSSGRAPGTSTGDVSADLDTLRADFNTLKDTVTNLISKKSSEALDSAKKTTSDVTDQIGDIANAATDQAKTFASELERMGRNNPLGALAGALLVGVVIGMIGRGGRS